MRLILTLTNGDPGYGGMPQYAKWHNFDTVTGFYTLPAVKVIWHDTGTISVKSSDWKSDPCSPSLTAMQDCVRSPAAARAALWSDEGQLSGRTQHGPARWQLFQARPSACYLLCSCSEAQNMSCLGVSGVLSQQVCMPTPAGVIQEGGGHADHAAQPLERPVLPGRPHHHGLGAGQRAAHARRRQRHCLEGAADSRRIALLLGTKAAMGWLAVCCGMGWLAVCLWHGMAGGLFAADVVMPTDDAYTQACHILGCSKSCTKVRHADLCRSGSTRWRHS